MNRALSVALVALIVAACPGCVTGALRDEILAPENPSVAVRSSIDGVSVAVVESRLQLVAVVGRGRERRFWTAPLAGRVDELAARRFTPAPDLSELPSSIVPVRFATRVESFVGHDATWWSTLEVRSNLAFVEGDNPAPIRREDLEHAALVSIRGGDERWSFYVSVPDGQARKLVATPEGIVPTIDDREDAPVALVDASAPGRAKDAGCARTLKRVGLAALLPLALAADVALSPFELVALAVF